MKQAARKKVLEKLDDLYDFIEQKITADGDAEFPLFNTDLVRIGEIRNTVTTENTFSQSRADEMNEMHRKYKLGVGDSKYIEILKTEGKIHAIKKYRANTSCGLKDAKDYIDALQKKHNVTVK